MRFILSIFVAAVFAQEPPSARALIHVARNEFAAGRVPEAERAARHALALMGATDPTESRIAASQILAMTLANAGRTREAADEITKALALGPQGARLGGIKHAMAMLAWTAGDLDSAARLMADGVALLVGSDEVWEAKADQAGVELARGNKARAAKLCLEALPKIEVIRGQNHPQFKTRTYTCATIQMEKAPRIAERQLLQLLDSGSFKLGVEKAILLAQIAKARLRTKRLGEAAAAIDEAVALARAANDLPLLKPVLKIQANALRAMKRNQEAAECEREAASLFVPPGNAVADARLLRTDAKRQTRGLSR